MTDQVFDLDAVRDAIRKEIELNGISPTKLSQLINPTNKSLIKDILDGGKDIKLSTLTKIAAVLDINVARLIPWAKPEMEKSLGLSSEALAPLLDALLPLMPPSGQMSEQSRRALSGALAYGVELLSEISGVEASQDAILVASRAVIDRFHSLGY